MQRRRRWTALPGLAALALLLALAAVPPRAAAQQFLDLHDFDSGSSRARGGLILGPDGNYYGTFANGGQNGTGGLFQLSVDPSGKASYTVFYSFTAVAANVNTDGANPSSSLALSPDGTLLYGTAPFGGPNGQGTLFSIALPTAAAPAPALNVLGSFGAASSANGFTGGFPSGKIVVTAAGVIYGTATSGGANFAGQIWKYDGSPGVLYDLNAPGQTGTNTDGESPQGLVLGPDGNLWGVCASGGANLSGTVFAVSTTGHYNVVHTYSNAPRNPAGYPVNADGALPLGLVPLNDGSGLYVITSYGGSNGLGAVGLAPVAGGYTVLGSLPGVDTSFHNTGGATPASAPQVASDGSIVESFSFGGANGNGAVSQIVLPSPADPAATLTLNPLYTFTGVDGNGKNADGASPVGPPLFITVGPSVGTGGPAGARVPTGRTAAQAAPRDTQAAQKGLVVLITSEGGQGGTPDVLGAILEFVTTLHPEASVTITVSPSIVAPGQTAVLSWTSEVVTTCTAGGAWSGARPLQGSANVTPAAVGSYDFTIHCTGPGGEAFDVATLTVQQGTGPTTVTINSATGQPITIATSGGTFTSGALAPTPTGADGQLGTGQSTPFGFVGFAIAGGPPSSTVTVTITVPLADGQTLAGYEKCTGLLGCAVLKPGTTLGNVTVSAINGNVLTLSCATDAAGNCEDPGAPVVTTASSSGGGGGTTAGTGGGSFDPWMLLALLLLGGNRRRRAAA